MGVAVALLWPAVCPSALSAAQRPSVFRGVVVADSPVGVRVVSVEDASPAALADLRPDDIIVRIQDQEVRTIEEFAAVSRDLKGRIHETTVLIFRNGLPHEVSLHLYSYPILGTWGLAFVPEHDVRFVERAAALAYWRRLGRGFEEAGKLDDALTAYLNGLHNVPEDLDTAVAASRLLAQLSRAHLASGPLAGGGPPLPPSGASPPSSGGVTFAEGLARLEQAMRLLERLFDRPLTDEQLRTVRDQLQEILRVLRETSLGPPGLPVGR
jgi:hypothetical protein